MTGHVYRQVFSLSQVAAGRKGAYTFQSNCKQVLPDIAPNYTLTLGGGGGRRKVRVTSLLMPGTTACAPTVRFRHRPRRLFLLYTVVFLTLFFFFLHSLLVFPFAL